MPPLAAGAGGLLAAGEEGAFPGGLIEGFERLVPLLENSEKDRHVLAAIQAGSKLAHSTAVTIMSIIAL
jgi:hypothetical protein